MVVRDFGQYWKHENSGTVQKMNFIEVKIIGPSLEYPKEKRVLIPLSIKSFNRKNVVSLHTFVGYLEMWCKVFRCPGSTQGL